MKLLQFSALLLMFFSLACSPKVVVLDRQTILEAEATGAFPNLEKSLQGRALQYGPKMVSRNQLQQKETPTKAHRILNGDLTRESATK
jgi:hypothetical protein